MPTYLFNLEALKVIWPIPITAILIGGIFIIFGWNGRERKFWFPTLFSFSLLGLVIGLLTGSSREPVVGSVLPAFLSLIGGLAIYLLGSKIKTRRLVSMCVLSLSISLLLGTFWGAVLREDWVRVKNSEPFLKMEALKEKRVQEFRERLGLKLREFQEKTE